MISCLILLLADLVKKTLSLYRHVVKQSLEIFVSGGYAHKTSASNDDKASPSETIECILARRYIADKDERQKTVRLKDLERMQKLIEKNRVEIVMVSLVEFCLENVLDQERRPKSTHHRLTRLV